MEIVIIDDSQSNRQPMDGLSPIRALRALPGHADIAVPMITARHERETRYCALEYGANDLLLSAPRTAALRRSAPRGGRVGRSPALGVLNKPIDGQKFRAPVRTWPPISAMALHSPGY